MFKHTTYLIIVGLRKYFVMIHSPLSTVPWTFLKVACKFFFHNPHFFASSYNSFSLKNVCLHSPLYIEYRILIPLISDILGYRYPRISYSWCKATVFCPFIYYPLHQSNVPFSTCHGLYQSWESFNMSSKDGYIFFCDGDDDSDHEKYNKNNLKHNVVFYSGKKWNNPCWCNLSPN